MGEIPAVGVGAATEPATRKHKTGLDVDGVEEEPSTGAASVYTIPRRKKMKAKTAAKPPDPDSAAWDGRPERGYYEVCRIKPEQGVLYLIYTAVYIVPPGRS